MKIAVHGGCHCGAVRFTARLDPAQGTSRCNCSICAKTRFWKAIAAAGDLELTAGADDLTSYRFGSGAVEHRFCRRCGVKVLGRAALPEAASAFYAVNVACLDDPPAELLAAPIAYEDGRHDAWDRAPPDAARL